MMPANSGSGCPLPDELHSHPDKDTHSPAGTCVVLAMVPLAEGTCVREPRPDQDCGAATPKPGCTKQAMA